MMRTVSNMTVVCIFMMLLPVWSWAAPSDMSNFCVTPPFIQTPILPNLLLLIDNSASMYDLGYTQAGSDCYDASYNDTRAYEGYFPTYPADSSGNKTGDYIYHYDTTINEFVQVSAFPTTPTATYNTSYLYIHMTGSGTSRYIDSFYATGNFLNWLAMSKLDIQKKILTGGKWVTGANSSLDAESRGCNGRRFVKSVPESNWINHLTGINASGATVTTLNFAIRGPNASEPGLVSPATMGGGTKVEIYESAYSYSACQTAITYWQNQILGSGVGNVGQQVQTCLNLAGTGNTSGGRENANFTEWARDCVQVAQNIRNGLTTYDPSAPNAGILKNVTPTNFAGNCEAVYKNDCTGVTSSGGSSTNNQSKIEVCSTLNNSLGGNYICSRKTNLMSSSVPSPYNAADYLVPTAYASVLNDGYAGSCWTGSTQGNVSVDFAPSYSGWTDNDCLARQILHFCASTVAANVIDPSSGSADSPTTGNIPAILVDAGLRSGGDPLPYGTATAPPTTPPPTTMQVNVAVGSQPADGLIQRYNGRIRLGVMTFNLDGSKSECYDPVTKTGPATSQVICGRYCLSSTSPTLTGSQTSCRADADCTVSGESCQLIPQTDGSRILPSAYIGDPIGDHTSGIIKAVDNIQATSWTPFSEAMYNAIGYFARDPSSGNSRWQLQSGDFDLTRNPQQYLCQPNNVLLITDGMSTADQNSTVKNVATWAQAASGLNAGQTGYDATNSCPKYSGSRNLDDIVWLAKNKNINALDLSSSSALAASAAPGVGSKHQSEYLTTYIVFNGADEPGMPGQCNPTNLLSAAAQNGGTTLLQATQPSIFKEQLDYAFRQIAGGASSGTAASILSNSEGSGAALLQAIFYPLKDFDNKTKASWIGELQSFWYYLDPYLQKTSIREDTDGDYKLNLINDKVVQFYFDPNKDQTFVNKYTDANGDGSADSSTPDTGFAGVSPETVNSLWRAGLNLWNRDVTTTAGQRTIYTGYNSNPGSTPQLFSSIDTTNFNNASVWDIMQIPASGTTGTSLTTAQRTTLATNLINYVSGSDQADDTAPICLLGSCAYRNRKVTICPTSTTCSTHEWKLGDIISSTPKLVTNVRLNTYNLAPPTGYGDSTYGNYVKSAAYANRGMVFVGANDGMLHAFRLGIMKELNGLYDKARVTTSTGSTAAAALQAELGQEAWAYIPSQALPYLKYLADPTYNHIYYLDKTPMIIDASIGVPSGCTATDYSGCVKSADGSTWRTILISGMGIGGASREQGTSSSTAVQPPVAGTGYSSYFALDVTDPVNPKYLWEFYGNTASSGAAPAPRLGFSTTGPAIVRIATKVNATSTTPDQTKNGKWFAVFASGPLGPIDSTTQSFKGQSDRPLRLFIVDLVSGALLRTINCSTEFGLNLSSAFGGSLASSTFDADRANQFSGGFYSDDAVYIGYVQQDPATGTWTKGGVLRLTTKESTNPADWVVSKLVDGTGPVTTSAAKLQDRGNRNLWIYFGTGRYYYKNDDYTSTSQQQAIYGLKEPCYTAANTLDKSCTASVDLSNVQDQSGSSSAPAATLSSSATGWKIVLDDKDTVNNYATERVITDPLAATNGAVFFTTFKPSSDLCQYGGNSLLWAVRYDTGSTPPSGSMKGKALMQVSTGAFQEITLASAFRNPGSTRYDGRRLATPIIGVPPTAQGLSLFSNPLPVKKILHYQER